MLNNKTNKIYLRFDIRQITYIHPIRFLLNLIVYLNSFIDLIEWLSLYVLLQNCRLYATKHLRVLLRANVEFFSNWGMELLVTQLHDHNKTVSVEALDVLDEACEDKVISITVTEIDAIK